MGLTVGFNDEEVAIHQELFSKGITSRTFSKFAKSSFYDAVDKLRAKTLNMEETNHETNQPEQE